MKDNLKQKIFSQKRLFPLSLVLFMLVIIIIIFIVYYLTPEDCSLNDFLLNLGTEMIGVFVSVILIDWIISRYRDEKWKKVDVKIKDRLDSNIELILAGFISATHLTILYKDEIKKKIKDSPNGLINVYWEIIRSKDIQSNLNDCIGKLKICQFKNLERIAEISKQRIYRTLNQYEFRIEQLPSLYVSLDNLIGDIEQLNIVLKNILIEDVELETKEIFTKNIIKSLIKVFNDLKEIKKII